MCYILAITEILCYIKMLCCLKIESNYVTLIINYAKYIKIITCVLSFALLSVATCKV